MYQRAIALTDTLEKGMTLALPAPLAITVRWGTPFSALFSVLQQFSLQLSHSVSVCPGTGVRMGDPAARVSLEPAKHLQGVSIAPIRWQPTVPLVRWEVTQISLRMAHLAPCVLQAPTSTQLGI